MQDPRSLIATMPKAELHMHLEGSIEPDLMFRLAARNGIKLNYASEAELQAAYDFSNLQSFLDVYYAGLTVLLTEQDFYDMTLDYMRRAHADHVVHAEVFISPQAHTRRGVPFAAMARGINAALQDAGREFGMTSGWIAGLQRQWPEEDAFAMLESMQAHPAGILGLGLGGPEVGNPPQKFERVFERARALGLRTVAHAGEEGPAAYVADTVDLLKVDRIDHGVHCDQDTRLVERLAHSQVPLTVCPISNVKLKVYPDLAAHNLKRLLRAGLRVTVNSDDPSYFLGYVNANYIGCQEALDLTREDMHALAKNSFTSAFIPDAEKTRYVGMLDTHFAN
jgi:adenosine deaminase